MQVFNSAPTAEVALDSANFKGKKLKIENFTQLYLFV